MPAFPGRGGWWMGLSTLLVLACATSWAAAEIHCQRTRNRAGLPCRPYGYDDPSNTVSARTLMAKPSEGPIALADGSGQPKNADALCKRFTFSQTSLENGPIVLSRIGMALYDTGEIACTALLSHNGGPTGDLLVNRVTIRVRAYGSTRMPPVEGDENLTGPCLCEWSQSYIVRRNDPIVVQLRSETAKPQLRRFFNEIVQLELDVIVRNSR
jgi:hypothetical protein